MTRSTRSIFFGSILLWSVASGVVHAQATAPDAEAEIADDGTESPDAATEKRLDRIFGQIADFEGIEVRVTDGVVHLAGTVDSAAVIDQATELAAKMDGVVFVDEEIETSTDVAARILPSVDESVAWARRAVMHVPLIVVALIAFLAFLFAAKRVRSAELAVGPLRTNHLLRNLARQTFAAAIVALGAVVALRILGLGYLVGGLLGGAGVLGLAVGFAFRDILENYLASILLSVRRPFRTMDLVDVDGTTGNVLRMTSSQTVLMTADGNHVRLPNATVFKGKVTNYTENPLRRFDFAIGVGGNEDLARAMSIGRATLKQMAGISDDPKPVARVEELGDSAVVVRYLAWVHQSEVSFPKARSEAVRLVKAALDEAGVDMPVPIYQVEMTRGRRAAEEVDAARPHPPSLGGSSDPREADVAPDDDEVERHIQSEAGAGTEENLLDS